jgi:ribonucleoside-diphosphate reductase alpha chain
MSETHKFVIAGHEGYITYSMFEDGTIAEIFVTMSKQGSTLSGLLDTFAISISMALQYGVPFKSLAKKFIFTRFEPSGFTENPNIRIATSIADYIFRYLALRFLSPDDLAEFGMTAVPQFIEEGESQEPREMKIKTPIEVGVGMGRNIAQDIGNGGLPEKKKMTQIATDTMCKKCGGMMVRTGTCLTCLQCGDSSGGCSYAQSPPMRRKKNKENSRLLSGFLLQEFSIKETFKRAKNSTKSDIFPHEIGRIDIFVISVL